MTCQQTLVRSSLTYKVFNLGNLFLQEQARQDCDRLEDCSHDLVDSLKEIYTEVSRYDLENMLLFLQETLQTDVSERASVSEVLSMRMLQ